MSSSHNGSGFYGLKEEVNDSLSREYFHVRLSGGGDTSVNYARTGYLGFLMKSDYVDQRGGRKEWRNQVGMIVGYDLFLFCLTQFLLLAYTLLELLMKHYPSGDSATIQLIWKLR